MSDPDHKSPYRERDNVVDFDAEFRRDHSRERSRAARFAELDELRRAEERRNAWGMFASILLVVVLILFLIWAINGGAFPA